jgi:hypothetical protein
MSRVFLAEETRLSRQVVIKMLPPEMGAGVNSDRFEREIQLAARLQHPHIVPLLTAGASGDLLYYIMPFIAGESLRVKLAREGELPIPDAVRILREVGDALAYAHANGVVHATSSRITCCSRPATRWSPTSAWPRRSAPRVVAPLSPRSASRLARRRYVLAKMAEDEARDEPARARLAKEPGA